MIPMQQINESEAPTAHTVSIPGGEWVAWRTVALRGAGFPAHQVLAMSAPRLAAAVDSRLDEGPFDGASLVSFEALLADELPSIRLAAAKIATEPRFREALAWQNRQVLRTAVDPFVREPGASNKRARERLSVVARYVQRYSVKNDTIGFFGPVGWATLVDRGPDVSVRPGARALASRSVSLETWAVDLVAAALEEELPIRPWTRPRLRPAFHLEGDELIVPFRPRVPLPRAHAWVLRHCLGELTASELAERAIGTPDVDLSSREEVFDVLERAVQLGVLTWRLEVPLSRVPEARLAERLDAIDDDVLGARARSIVDELVAAKERVAASAGDADAVDASMAAIEVTFSRLTGAAATRRLGETYASRTILYEDCRRDADVTLGPGVLKKLGPALTIALDAARWVSWEIATAYRAVLESIYDEGVRETGRQDVDLAMVFREYEKRCLRPTNRPLIDEVTARLASKWAELVPLHTGARVARVASGTIADAARRAFACPGMGWPGAYISPDLMIAADGLDSIERGDYLAILGEVHAYNTLRGAWIASQHPDADALGRMIARDYPGPRLVPLEAKEHFSYRLTAPVVSPEAYRLQLSDDPPSCARERLVTVGEVIVRREDGRLRLCTRDGRAEFDADDLLGASLELLCSGAMSFAAVGEHVPRVQVDDLVLGRERWTVAADDTPFGATHGTAAWFAEARRWARGRGFPRFVFVRLPTEKKPLFVDFDSPIYVDVLARLVRKLTDEGAPGRTIVVSEMLPAVDQTWLVDATGRRHTCELRIVTHPAPAAVAT